MTLAPSNAALVKRVVELCSRHGRRPATVQEARALLNLAARDPENWDMKSDAASWNMRCASKFCEFGRFRPTLKLVTLHHTSPRE